MRSFFTFSLLRLFASLVFLSLAGGCVVLTPGHAPGQIVTAREPDTNREYQLYVPSNYTRDRAWPLVIACHGGRPLDWPGAQIDEWKGLAESKGFFVAAPELLGTSGDLSGDVSRQLAGLRQDEEAVRAIVAHVRASRNIETNAVFIVGWLAGAHPAMFVGLRNPDVFRALALRQPRFDPRLVQPCESYLDHQQSIQVVYGPTDFARDQAVACVEWLRTRRMIVAEQETGSAHKREPEPTYAFFREIVRTRAWIRVVATEPDPARPLAVQYSLFSSVPVDQYLWEFGDGQTSRIASPEHTYAAAGTYTVRVTATSGKKSHVRRLELHVPRTRLGATPNTTQPVAPRQASVRP